MNITIDPDGTPDELRQRIYDGNLVVLTRLQSLQEFVEYTREELTELFKPHDPEHVHEFIEPPEMAKILGAWKPGFIHAEKSKKLVRAVIEEAGFPAEQTHYDLPKPRTSFPVGHLTTGVAFAFPWHRDVWYSAPAQQINWWLPIFPVREDNAMSFDLASFDQAVPQHLGHLRLLPEQCQPVHHGDAGHQGSARPGPGRWTTSPIRSWSSCPRPARSCCSPALSCMPRSRTCPAGPGSASTSGPSTSRICGSAGARRWWMPTAPGLRSGTSSTSRTSAASTRRLVQDLFGPPPEGALLVFGAQEQKA